MEVIAEHYQWIFSGIGVLIIGYLINLFIKNRDANKEASVANNNSVVVNNHVGAVQTKEISKVDGLDERVKTKTRILFVDDKHTDFKMVSILKKSGWINTKSVKDIIDLDDSKVLEADIIFVDINGVGTTMFQDEGLGLASALKKKYAHKKIILYSSETTGDRFHRALREVDDCLPKNAEPYQFVNVIEGLIKEA